MTYDKLIEETGAQIGIEGFAPDADGVCVIVSEIGEITIMDCTEGPVELVLLNAAVADVPPDAGAALSEALKANWCFKDTRGATLHIDSETNRFELSQHARLEDLDPDKLILIVEDFATALVDLRNRLDGEHLSGSPVAVSETLGMDGFIRV